MMLAVMLLVRETSPLKTAWCEWPLKKSAGQLYIDRRRQLEFSQLGQQSGVSDGVERLGKIQRNDDDKRIELQQVNNSVNYLIVCSLYREFCCNGESLPSQCTHYNIMPSTCPPGSPHLRWRRPLYHTNIFLL